MLSRPKGADSSRDLDIQFYAVVFFCVLEERHAAVIQKATGFSAGREDKVEAGRTHSLGALEARIQ